MPAGQSKRQAPNTPAALKSNAPASPAIVQYQKKVKEYASPVAVRTTNTVLEKGTTPLRNYVNQEDLFKKPMAVEQRRVKLDKRKPPKPPLSAITSNLLVTPRGTRTLPSNKAEASSNTPQQIRDFDGWLKQISENKVNSSNSFNNSIIDYFVEMKVLRDAEGKGAINFQKASTTLLGCVKVFSVRVDCVREEALRLLSRISSKDSERAVEDDQVGETKKRASRQTATLEKSWDAITLKRVEISHAIVDPLFKKTCAEFDESGSRGLLAYTLGIAADGERMLFDSAEPGFLQAGSDASGLEEAFEALAINTDLPISDSLTNFVLGETKELTLLESVTQETRSLAFNPFSHNAANDMQDYPPFENAPLDYTSADYVPAEYAPVDYADDYDYLPPEAHYESADEEEIRASDDERPLFAANEVEEERFAPLDENEETNYLSHFDQSFNVSSGWAGPEHWKIQRRVGINEVTSKETTAPKQKRVKNVVAIDFMEEAPDREQLYVKPTSAHLITFNLTQIQEMQSKPQDLPPDLRFSSKDLLGLFSKPNWRKVLIRRPNVAPRDDPFQETHLEADYWAEQPQNEGGLDAADYVADDYAAADYLPDDLPNNFDTYPMQPEAMPEMVSNLPQAVTRAKRVNIQKLKQCLWTGISEGKLCTLSALMQALPAFYTEEDQRQELGDISVAYCFICLLHLANERGLELRGDALIAGGDLEIVLLK